MRLASGEHPSGDRRDQWKSERERQQMTDRRGREVAEIRAVRGHQRGIGAGGAEDAGVVNVFVNQGLVRDGFERGDCLRWSDAVAN